MKKLFAFILSLALVISMGACGGELSHVPEEITDDPPISFTEDEPVATPEITPAEQTETQSIDIPEEPDITPTEAQTEAMKVPEGSTFNIHFIDVGQADAALVECDGEYMLIDGGNKADSQKIYSVLKSAGADHLKLVVGTHGHEDHIGGLASAYAYATVDTTLCSVTEFDSNAFEDFAEYAEKNGGGITVPTVGDIYALGSANIEILGVNSTEEANNTSIVLRIDYGATSFLFTGDAEWDAEQAILASVCKLDSTVLKVGHHGSSSSTGYQFLRQIAPKYAVISVGEGNEYGHPTEEVLSRLRDADVTVFRTDMQGDIYCSSDGKTVTFTTERNADADTLSGAGAGGTHTSDEAEETEAATELTEDNDSPATTYVANTNTGKFHYPSCSSVDQMSEKNKLEVTQTRDELIQQGYSPCGRCHP